MENKTEKLGQQIINNWNKSAAPECREVTNESWWKTFHPRLKKEIESYKGSVDKIFILLNMKNEGILGTNVKHATWLVFTEEPPPKDMACLWSYKKSTEELRIEWVLPDLTSIEEICANPETYDKKLVHDCMQFKKAQVIKINAKDLKRPKAVPFLLS